MDGAGHRPDYVGRDEAIPIRAGRTVLATAGALPAASGSLPAAAGAVKGPAALPLLRLPISDQVVPAARRGV